MRHCLASGNTVIDANVVGVGPKLPVQGGLCAVNQA
jgi:hypothetical protein